jgi:hypothetical protein
MAPEVLKAYPDGGLAIGARQAVYGLAERSRTTTSTHQLGLMDMAWRVYLLERDVFARCCSTDLAQAASR